MRNLENLKNLLRCIIDSINIYTGISIETIHKIFVDSYFFSKFQIQNIYIKKVKI